MSANDNQEFQKIATSDDHRWKVDTYLGSLMTNFSSLGRHPLVASGNKTPESIASFTEALNKCAPTTDHEKWIVATIQSLDEMNRKSAHTRKDRPSLMFSTHSALAQVLNGRSIANMLRVDGIDITVGEKGFRVALSTKESGRNRKHDRPDRARSRDGPGHNGAGHKSASKPAMDLNQCNSILSAIAGTETKDMPVSVSYRDAVAKGSPIVEEIASKPATAPLNLPVAANSSIPKSPAAPVLEEIASKPATRSGFKIGMSWADVPDDDVKTNSVGHSENAAKPVGKAPDANSDAKPVTHTETKAVTHVEAKSAEAKSNGIKSPKELAKAKAVPAKTAKPVPKDSKPPKAKTPPPKKDDADIDDVLNSIL